MAIKYPGSFSADILQREFAPKEFGSIVDSYNAAKLRVVNIKPTKKQYQMAAMVKLAGPKPTAKKFKVSQAVANYALLKVAKYEYLS